MSEKVVLLIDDEEHILSSLKRLLRKEPYRVIATTRPEEALKMLERLKVALVITNQMMEGIDGDEVIRRVHEKAPGLKCVKLTGYCDGSGAIAKNGAWRVVPKPWNDDELKALIREGLGDDVSATVLDKSNREEEETWTIIPS